MSHCIHSIGISANRQVHLTRQPTALTSLGRSFLVVAAMLFSTAVPSISWAQSISTWIGGDGTWSEPEAWISTVPGASTDVVFDSSLSSVGGTVLMNPGAGDREARSITFDTGAGSYIFVINGMGKPKILHLGAGGIKNNSVATQTFSGQLNLEASQTWVAAEGDIVTERMIELGGHRLSFAGSSDFIINGPIAGTGNIEKTGSGTLFVNATPTFTGSTLLAAGTLQYGADVPAGGALILQGGNLIANDRNLVFSSFQLSGFASITLGIDNVSQRMTFGDAIYESGTLTIYNWSSDPTSDSIFFASKPGQEFLDKVTFDGFAPGSLWSNGVLTPIPEPAPIALLVVGGMVVFFRIRRKKAIARASA